MVPALAVAAHGMASGTPLSATGIALCVLLGVVTGAVVDLTCRTGLSGRGVLIGILSVAQGLAHLALSTDGHHSASAMAGHSMHSGAHDPAMVTHHLHALLSPWSADGASMLLTHLVAVPLTAVLVTVAAAVTGVVTAVAATLRDPGPLPRTIRTAPVPSSVDAGCPRVDRAAGPGERGPPRVPAPV